MSNVEHLLMCLLAICMCSLEKCLFSLFLTFWLGCLFSWYWIVCMACIFWKLILYQLFHLLLFSPILRIVCSLLEQEIATCSSVLAWKIPWTEEPGGLQPMGSQRVRRNQATEHRHAGKQQANIPSGHCQGRSDHRIHSRGRDYSKSPRSAAIQRDSGHWV